VDPNQVADQLHSAAIHVLRRVSELETEVTPARLSALSVVVFRGPLTLGDLARAERVRSPTMTGIVKGLEADGLVVRRAHATDGRSALLEATPMGRRLLARERRRRIEHIAARLGDLGSPELELLWRAGQLVEDRFALRPWQPVGREC
jgi:DNA-binding MarR family transcriptional regulator